MLRVVCYVEDGEEEENVVGGLGGRAWLTKGQGHGGPITVAARWHHPARTQTYHGGSLTNRTPGCAHATEWPTPRCLG